jgi:hypothetical protein
MITKAIPLESFSSTILREALHGIFSMKALLAVTAKGAKHFTAQDMTSNLLRGASEELVEGFRHNAQTAAEAAAIVFIHSTCEKAVFQLIEVLVHIDVEPWSSSVAEKRVSFKEVSSSTLDKIRKRLLRDYLADLERKSFPEKVERLLAAIKPKPATVSQAIPGFNFSLDKLKEIDDLRHKLAHHPQFAEPIPDAPAKLDYMLDTLKLLVALANKKYAGGTG